MSDQDNNPLPGFEQDWADAAADGACTCTFWTVKHVPDAAYDGTTRIDPACYEHGYLLNACWLEGQLR